MNDARTDETETDCDVEPQILPRDWSRVPFVIGNLGASAIIDLAKSRPLASDPLLGKLDRYAALGVDAIEDYIGWSVVEPREGELDFSRHREHRDAVRRLGMQYVAYPWMHALPSFIADESRFEPFRCLEHGLATIHPSIFAPSTLELFDRFYALLARGFDGDLPAITLAMPCDYGEVGYPTGMGAWVLNGDSDAVHRHAGFWCGDDHALSDFRQRMLHRFGSLDAVNAVFGTSFAREDDLRPLPPPHLDVHSDRFRFELIEWYREAVLRFLRSLVLIVRRHFPSSRLAIKCGYGGELACFGQDYARLVPLARELGLTIWSTHGTLPTVFHKRIATLCRVHGVPYFTESPSERSREQVRDRLFEDAAEGSRGFFEFSDTFDAFESDFLAHRHLLRGETPSIEFAVLFHSTAQMLEPGRSLPPGLVAIGEELRDLVDYDVIDEETAAIAPLGRYSVLLVPDPGPAFAPAIAALERYVEQGGIVVVAASPDLQPIGGRAAFLASRPDLSIHLPPGELKSVATREYDAIAFGSGTDEWALFGDHLGPERADAYFGTRAHPYSRWIGSHAGFRMPRPLSDDAILEITLFADPRALTIPYVVTCDGAEIARITEPGAQTLEFTLGPRSVEDRAHFEIAFQGTPFRPADDGSPDRRALGLLLHRATTRPYDGTSTAPTPTGPALYARLDPRSLLTTRFTSRGRGGVLLAPANDRMALVAAALCAFEHRSAFVQGATEPTPRSIPIGVRVVSSRDRTITYHRNEAVRSIVELPRLV